MRLIYLLFFLLLSTKSYADLASKVGISISIDKTNMFLEEISGDYLLNDQEIEFGSGGFFDQIEKSRSAISLDADIGFRLSGGNKVSADVKFRDFVLSLEDFVYEQITIITRSGIRARVKTRIVCSVLPISFKNWEGQMSTSVSYNGETLVLNRNDGVFDLKGSDIGIDLSSCTAPRGVDTLFRAEIKKWVDSPSGRDLLLGQALDFGQDFIDKNWKNIQEKELKFNLLGKEISVSLEEIEFFDDHLEALGVLNVENEEKDYLLELEEGALRATKSKVGILFPKDFFSKLVPDVIKESSLSFEMYRAEIPGVDFLFNSRFIQFFVWSDLLNFRKKSNFKAGIDISDADVSLQTNNSRSFSYGLRGRHNVEMSFLNSLGTAYPYMNFFGGIKGGIDLNLTDEGFSLKINNPDVSAKCDWHPLMTSWRKSKPKGKPWMSMILPRVEKAFKGTEFSYTWKDIGLEDFIEKVSIEHLDSSVFLNVGLK